MAKLCQHNPVTVFDNNGLKPASKQSLKCATCGTIYNYSQFGKKKSSWERFYDQQRMFVGKTVAEMAC